MSGHENTEEIPYQTGRLSALHAAWTRAVHLMAIDAAAGPPTQP
jgi:hypothetical protein